MESKATPRRFISALLSGGVVAVTAAVGLVAGTPVAAQPSLLSQSSLSSLSATSSGSSSSEMKLREAIVGSSEDPEQSGALLGLVASSISLSSLPGFAVHPPKEAPPIPDPTITEVSVLSREMVDEQRRIERWQIASPAMGRVIPVDIRLPKTANAPQLVMLDGVEAAKESDWLYASGQRFFNKVLGEEDVTVIVPIGGMGSWYADWVEDDPVLGRNQWETFIIKEVLLLMENPDFGYNGKRAIGGISMGATAAIRMAEANPELFDATFGISGCYSTRSAMGELSMRSVVESRGGKIENMLGKRDNPAWNRADTVSHPEGLRNVEVYMSAATGALPNVPRPDELSMNDLVTSILLERGVYDCTKEMDAAMRDHGMGHHKVNYVHYGVHNWNTFNVELEPAWNHVKRVLY
ncbi:alpha/beta hydrolase [Corynebacterium cystitidis]|uniref:alpha/beta hydrolase n=1 Tax=Corynebacterium cystitidis TaxID=35757 RepID=UPI00211DB19D|nr:alpha/beta hydrolase family protein [Corynebacterium cystitidis]